MNALAVSGQSPKGLLEFNLAEARRGGLREGTENETYRKKKKKVWLKSQTWRWEIDAWRENVWGCVCLTLTACFARAQMSLLLCKHGCALLSTVSHSLSCPLLFAYRQHSDEISNIARSVHTAALLACDSRLTAKRCFHLLSEHGSPQFLCEMWTKATSPTWLSAAIGLFSTYFSIFVTGRSS